MRQGPAIEAGVSNEALTAAARALTFGSHGVDDSAKLATVESLRPGLRSSVVVDLLCTARYEYGSCHSTEVNDAIENLLRSPDIKEFDKPVVNELFRRIDREA
jgi:hypothetical protein